MSVQFGRWNFEGQPPAPGYIEKVSAALAPYGPDSNESYSKGGTKILYRAFHTTMESHHETQPHISQSGAVITWDGRLDNRAELINELRDSLTIGSTDVVIVATAYEKWGTNCFAKLIGDWALSIWSPVNRSLILAKDPIGTKHLYYSFDNRQITWSTILDPLVLFAGRNFVLNEEYIAGWFANMIPAAHLTPYVGVHSVPPSSSVLLRPGKEAVSKYWDFDPAKKIRYRTDAEYEEHFRTVLATAVQRRLRSDRPVLAELSGGMDSASVVCMADTIIGRGVAQISRLDTISWYEDSNPGVNERPYFTKVEERRGCAGFHIDLASLREDNPQISFGSDFESDRFAATPFSNATLSSEFFHRYIAYMRSQKYRVTLSGIGGEEATGGGVPTPKPELQNLFARARLFTLIRQLNAWATRMKKPQLPLLWEAIRGFLPRVTTVKDMVPAPLFHPDFLHRNRAGLRRYSSRVKLFGPLPSFQHHIHELEDARRFMAAGFELHSEWLREIRFPYLDRDLLEFTYAVPQEQNVRVGQRRSLMKRALVGIVPVEILNRRRMAFIPLEPKEQGEKKQTLAKWPSLAEIGQHIIGSSIGIIDPNRFWEALEKARLNEKVPIANLNFTLKLESWLRHLTIQGVLTDSMRTERQDCPLPVEAKERQVPACTKVSVS